VFPGIDEEAVKAAQGCEEDRMREQGDAEVGTAGDGGNKGGCGEEEANCDLLRKTMSAAGGMDENEVPGEQAAEDQVEVNGRGFETGQEDCKCDGGCEDAGKERTAMAVVKVVTRFEVSIGYDSDEACIKKTIGDVEHPDREEHGNNANGWQAKVIGEGDEPNPEGSNGWGI